MINIKKILMVLIGAGTMALALSAGALNTEQASAQETECEHEYKEVVIKPTCTHEGYTTHFCLLCGYEYTDNYTAASGHRYTSEETAPTCTEMGYITYTCTVCGYSYRDNYKPERGHSYETEVKESTCTEGGYTKYRCTECGDTYIADYTEETGHKYEVRTLPATCVAYGYTLHRCETCGDRYVTDYKLPLGHDFMEQRIEATEEKIGYTKYVCKNCDYSYVTDFVTSGDNGYIEEKPDEPDEEEHTHEYNVEIVTKEEEKTFTIKAICECGAEGKTEYSVYTEKANGEQTELTADETGKYDYSELEGYEEIVVKDKQGEEVVRKEIPREEPPKHNHEFEYHIEQRAEEGYILVTKRCGCGEEQTAKIEAYFIEEGGETIKRTSDEQGRVALKGLEKKYTVEVRTETEEVIASFALDLTRQPSDSSETEDNTGDSESGTTGATEPATNLDLVIGLIAGALLLAVTGIAIFLIIRKKNKNNNNKNEKNNK